MADEREPPPLFEDEDINEKDPDSDELFPPVPETTAKVDNKKDDDDMEDIFAEAQSEVPLDSPEKEKSDAPKQESDDSGPEELEPVKTASAPASSPATMKADTTSSSIHPPGLSASASSSSSSAVKPLNSAAASRSKEEVEEEEGGDQFNMEITVSDPKKIGDGMGAYMAYKVSTKTTIPEYKKSEFSVYRRFSDFLGIHEKLVESHQHTGRIIPPPPEKSVLGMTKIKMSKEEAGSADFVEKRRAALDRFLNRTAKHPTLRIDDDFVDFLTKDGDLPRSNSTSALSGAGMLRLFSKVGEGFGKMTFKMDETDQWFEEKQQQIESLDTQLKKLHSSIEALVTHRRELAQNTGSFAKSAAMLGNAEEHTALSRALSQLAEIEEKIDQLHMDQADSDFFVLSELIKDYLSLIGAVKDVFHERVKSFKNWKDAEQTLAKKRENKAKFELQRKADKIPMANQEITEWEHKVDKGQEDFENISRNIHKEISRFEKQRIKDFKTTIVHYLESLMNGQQQLIKQWESFLPEAKAIA